MKNVELVTFDCPRWLRENCISGERLNIINPSTSFPRRLLHLPWNDWLLFPCWMHFAPGGTSSCAGAPRGAALVGIQNVSRRKWRIDRSIGKERERERDPGGREPREISCIRIRDPEYRRWTDRIPPSALYSPCIQPPHTYVFTCICMCMCVCARFREALREPRLHCKNMRMGILRGWFSWRCCHTLPRSKFRCCDNNERLSETEKPTFAMQIHEFHPRWDADSQSRKTGVRFRAKVSRIRARIVAIDYTALPVERHST